MNLNLSLLVSIAVYASKVPLGILSAFLLSLSNAIKLNFALAVKCRQAEFPRTLKLKILLIE